jgi:23S rRNA (adenine2503-C2)-methyltransferase
MKGKQLLGMDREELAAVAAEMGEKPFRGRQLYVQIYRRKVGSFAEMTDLAQSFRSRLEERYTLSLPEVQRRSDSQDGTVKLLLRLEDGQMVETVHIPEENRDTLCISSQVGCDVGCTFCLTAQMGFRRNLTPGEIVGQVLRVIREGLVGENGFNIVFMGMGEPLYNYRNVMKAFRLLTDPEGMNLSHRKITISTSGVVPVLRRMAAEPVVPNLAVSLNSSTSSLRDRIMPINRKWSLAELLETLRAFPLEPRRRITIEYVLLRDENDSPADARRLAELLQGLAVKINLIPYNPNPGLPHRRPEPERVGRFQAVLSEHNLASFVRRTRGADVSAACGQLAFLEQPPALLQV